MAKVKTSRKHNVLLVHNMDSSWTAAEKRNALKEIKGIESAIRSCKLKVKNIVLENTDLYPLICGYDPETHVIFNCCEGLPGIDHSESTVASIMESLKFSFTGSNSSTLNLCWDKRRTKMLLEKHGVPTPKWRIYESPLLLFDDWNFYPAIAKPAMEHCSYGVTPDAVILTKQELKKRISFVLHNFSQPALVEDFIDGREFHVTLWGNDQIKMLPPAEMDFSAFENIHDRLCTYDSKFEPDSIHYKKIKVKVPAELSKKEHEALKEIAIKAFNVAGCRDYGRIDLRLRNGIFYVLDVNANPDISKETSMAEAAKLSGFSYNKMIGNILSFAVKRHHTKKVIRHARKKSSRHDCYLPNFK
ncbi:MAG TPA: hypothetical protein DET40_09905 [Lentisphaeria bacterium]|nr:MAG: hypothetical protein A2X45_08690 [Lentisphaerae bacterium GWF2_50_93]HCE43849.1 hypothetical protein [Lentisphaeria bacterium]